MTLLEQENKDEVENTPCTEEEKEQVKRIVEALLFASSEPLTINKIRKITERCYPFSAKELRVILDELKREYFEDGRSFQLDEIAQGFILRSSEEFSSYIDELFTGRRKERLSQAKAEVLAIIAYRQPITRQKIELIRGVDCSGPIHTLLEKGLIESKGKEEVPGRPTLYGVTKEFLHHFGLKDIKELSDKI